MCKVCAYGSHGNHFRNQRHKSNNRKNDRCQYCNKLGHWKRDCCKFKYEQSRRNKLKYPGEEQAQLVTSNENNSCGSSPNAFGVQVFFSPALKEDNLELHGNRLLLASQARCVTENEYKFAQKTLK